MTEDQDPIPDPMGDRERWDADDPRRQHDQMAPPAEPCECYCLHCGRVFMSDQIWFQKVIGDKSGFEGFWMCPTPNCDGAGFTFDIFPTDPEHPANDDWCHDDDDDYGEDAFDDEGNYIEPEDRVYDPREPEYPATDATNSHTAGDIEGEEWKYGLEPGEALPEPDWLQRQRQEQEDEERRYNEPDERPRELDWSNREERSGGGEVEF